MTDTYLLLIAVEVGLIAMALVSGIVMEIVNNCYMRRCHAEAQAEAKKAAAANPFANMAFIPGQVAQQPAGQPAQTCGKECGSDCKGECSKQEKTGQYL